MVCATSTNTTAGGLANLLGVSKKTIALWHRRAVIQGHRTPADRRRYLFDLRDIRQAIDRHALPVRPEALTVIDNALAGGR